MQILLVIDVQQRYLKNYKPDLVNRVHARIREAMSKEIPVVYVRNTGRSGKDNNFELADGLEVSSDIIFKKQFPSAFSNPDFEPFLTRANIDTINVVGVDGRCCVFRTVMTAIEQGFGVKLYLDAIGARHSRFYEKELQEMKAAGAECVEYHS